MVLPVGDVDIAILIERNAPGLIELAGSFAGTAALADEFTIGSEDLQPVVSTVNDDQVAVLFDRQARRTQQLAITAAGRSELGDELATGVEHRDRIGPLVRAVDSVPLIVDGDAERPDRIAVTLAVFIKIVEQFLFSGATELYLVGMHPEIVFVASICGIDRAIFVKAHALDVVEPGTPGRATPDSVAPIENPSARDRCQRHGFLQFSLPPSNRKGITVFCVVAIPAPAPLIRSRGKAKAGAGSAVGIAPVNLERPV